MNYYNKFRCLKNILLNKYGFSTYPVAVRWNITGKCPNNCAYCSFHKTNKVELSHKEINKIFIVLKKIGICRMSISGGEPLLSKNFEYIVDKCIINRISPIINSSGINVENQLAALKKLDLVQLSIDGPPEIMEKSRDSKSFNHFINAVTFLKKNNIKFSFCCTLTKYNTNINTLSYLLDLAHQYKAFIAFQPIKDVYQNNYFASLAPEQKKYQECINYLIDKKNNGNTKIRNTTTSLKYIYNWPNYKNKLCSAGNLFFVIEPDGTIVGCDRTNEKNISNLNILKNNIKDILNNIKQVKCNGCGFLGALELAYLYNNNYSPINILNKL